MMMVILKCIFNFIKDYFTFRKAMKFERNDMICTAAEDSIIEKLGPFKHKPVTENDIIEDLTNLIREGKMPKIENAASKEEVNLIEEKEGLALLLSNLDNEDEMNKACDFIKENHLVEDYQ